MDIPTYRKLVQQNAPTVWALRKNKDDVETPPQATPPTQSKLHLENTQKKFVPVEEEDDFIKGLEKDQLNYDSRSSTTTVNKA